VQRNVDLMILSLEESLPLIVAHTERNLPRAQRRLAEESGPVTPSDIEPVTLAVHCATWLILIKVQWAPRLALGKNVDSSNSNGP